MSDAPADLDAMLARVNDEASFIAFLNALAADFAADREILAADPDRYKYASGPLGWENGTVSDFLGAAGAWESRSGYENPWQRCAEILYSGKFYE